MVRVHHAEQRQLRTAVCDIVFGVFKVYSIHITEFQKRGPPHLHLASKVSREAVTPEEPDEVISAELPKKDDELLQSVNKVMIHQHRPDQIVVTVQKLHRSSKFVNTDIESHWFKELIMTNLVTHIINDKERRTVSVYHITQNF